MRTYPLVTLGALAISLIGIAVWRDASKIEDAGWWGCLRTFYGGQGLTFTLGGLALLIASLIT